MSTCNSKNFSGGYTPGPPLTAKGRSWKEAKRQGEGGREGRREKGKGKEKGKGRKKGKKGKARRRGREKKGRENKGREGMIGPPKRNSWIRHWKY
jgi:hypothetical protein